MSDDNELKEKSGSSANLEETARENLVIVYVNEFTEASAKEFYEEFRKAQDSGQTVIPIIIDSYGGEIYSLISMIDLIKSSRVPVATIAIGKAMSCGADLLCSGTKGMRYASPMCSILVHQSTDYAGGKLSDLKVSVKETERIDQMIFDMLDRNCGSTKGYLQQILKDNMNTDIYMTAEEAKKHGLIDHIRVPRIDTIVVTKTALI